MIQKYTERILVYMLGVFVSVVGKYLIYDVLYLGSDVFYLPVHYLTLFGCDILQLLEQLPQVHVTHLQFLLELEHSERVVVQGHSRNSH